MSRRLIGLDIDSVLNGAAEHALLEDLLDSGRANGDEDLPTVAALYGIKFFKPGKDHGWGNYVSVLQCDRLKALQDKYGAEIVGVSSWFTSKEKDEIAEFLGVEIKYIAPCTGGGIHRAEGMYQFAEEYQPTSFVLLDDQKEGYAEYGFADYHVAPDGMGMSAYDWHKADEILGSDSFELRAIV